MRSNAIELREKVAMPDSDFLVKVFYYEQKDPGGLFALHWHENLEFIYIVSGSMTMECNGVSLEVPAGSAIVINSNEYHSCPYSQGNLALYCVMADAAVLNSRFFDACEEKYIQPVFRNNILFKNLVTSSERFYRYIIEIAEEYAAKQSGFELAIKAALYNLLVFLLRNNVERILSPRESSIRNTNHQRVNSILQYIDENYMDEVNIGVISKKLGISKFYFCKLFKKMTGKTITEYVNYVRIREAVVLLHETGMSITDIAMMVGFSDINYFSRIFKSIINQSPTAVRKSAQEAKS